MWKLAACTAIGFAVGIAVPTYSATPKSPSPALAGPSVRVEMSGGLGSGTNIGDGNILTAAHVVQDETTAKIVLDNGKSVKGSVVWISKKYDVALIHIDAKIKEATAHLSCRTPKIGEPVHADGNPGGMKFIHMQGYIAGAAQAYGPQWASAYTVDMSVISGMSGGGLFDRYGNVVGVVVGAMDPYEAKNEARMAVGSIGFVVPGKDVCLLMGRV